MIRPVKVSVDYEVILNAFFLCVLCGLCGFQIKMFAQINEPKGFFQAVFRSATERETRDF